MHTLYTNDTNKTDTKFKFRSDLKYQSCKLEMTFVKLNYEMDEIFMKYYQPVS